MAIVVGNPATSLTTFLVNIPILIIDILIGLSPFGYGSYTVAVSPSRCDCVIGGSPVGRAYECPCIGFPRPSLYRATSARRGPINGGPVRQFNVGPGSASFRRSTYRSTWPQSGHCQ
jgi:hypothetical protein